MAKLKAAGTVLVTGASGRIGGRVLEELSGRGWRTRALVHTRSAPEADERVKGSLTEPASLAAAADGVDGVVHMAAATHARRTGTYLTVNRDGTAALVAAARAAAVKSFVFVSTRAIAAEGGGYSRSKNEAEAIVRSSGLNHAIVRLPEVIGAGADEGVDSVISRARRGSPIPIIGSGHHRLCPAHIDDVVPPIAAALDAPRDRTYTLAGECVTERDFAKACVDAFGSRSRLVTVPVPAVELMGWLSRVAPIPLYPDQLDRLRASKPEVSSRAASDLGFAPHSLRDCLRAVSPESKG